MDNDLSTSEYKELLERELNELADVELFLQNENVQKHFLKPFDDELNELKDAYDCDTLKELHFTKGKKKGLLFLAETEESIHNRIKQIQMELSQLG